MAVARGAKGTTRFLLVLTDKSVVTLSAAGRAWISLKLGLNAPNSDDLVLRNRHSYSSPFSCFSLRQSIMALVYQEESLWLSLLLLNRRSINQVNEVTIAVLEEARIEEKSRKGMSLPGWQFQGSAWC
jgi:hypothetical protein